MEDSLKVLSEIGPMDVTDDMLAVLAVLAMDDTGRRWRRLGLDDVFGIRPELLLVERKRALA